MFRKMQMMTMSMMMMTMMTLAMMMMTMMTMSIMMMTMIGLVSGADSAPDWRLALS